MENQKTLVSSTDTVVFENDYPKFYIPYMVIHKRNTKLSLIFYKNR